MHCAAVDLFLVLKIFRHKPKYWTHLNLDLITALDEKLLVTDTNIIGLYLVLSCIIQYERSFYDKLSLLNIISGEKLTKQKR